MDTGLSPVLVENKAGSLDSGTDEDETLRTWAQPSIQPQ